MISGLFNVYSYCLLAEHKNSNNYSLTEEMLTMDRLVRDFSAKDPEGLCDIMKVWSSLTIASVLRGRENNPSFLNTLTEGLSTYKDTYLFKHLTRKIDDD